AYSRVEADPDNAANHVLHLITTGAIGHMHDHLETTLANGRAVADGRTYQISFRAKWVAGNNRLNTRLYFNRLAQTTSLPRPAQRGTPGARNSTFTGNTGPNYFGLHHSPLVPQPADPVTVNVAAFDPQGIQSMSLWWSVNGGGWQTISMTPTGGANEPGYTNYQATVPRQSAGAVVQFYIQGADTLGARSAFPAGGVDSRALFKVSDGVALMSQLHRLSLITTPADTALLHAVTNVMTDDRKGLTVIEDEREVFYDVGVHLQSSERGRSDSSRVGFAVKFHPDQLYRGVQNTITLDRSGGYSGRGGRQDEIVLWHAANHAGGLHGINCDLVQVFTPRPEDDSTAMMRMSAYDSAYWDGAFKNGGDGNLYKLELIYYPTTTLTGNPQSPKVPQPDDVINVEIQNSGDNPENYRWQFLEENHADADDYCQLIALNKAFSLTGAALETRTSELMDVDEWMRVLAFKAFTGEADTFTYGLNHNFMIYFRPADGRALGLLWDMDFDFSQPVNYSSPGSSSANTYKIVKLPDNYRRYYHHLFDIMTTSVNSAYLAPWIAHYSGLLGQDWSGVTSYLQQRADYLRGTMPLTTAFAITSNQGKNFATTGDSVALAGTAPIQVGNIQVNGAIYPVRWTSLTAWTLTVPLPNQINKVALLGLGDDGLPLPNLSANITITNTAARNLLPVVINEWMAGNSAPGGFTDPADGHYSDWFEMYNPNGVPVNLGGFGLSDTLTPPAKWMIPANTVIAPHGFLLVWADKQTNLNTSASSGDLHADFKLSKDGSVIVLTGTNGVPQHAVTFGPQADNISQGFYPDGNTNAVISMSNWTPRAPNQPGSPPAPQIVSIQFSGLGAASFNIDAVAGRTYQVEFKDTLNAPGWTPLGPPRTATTSQLIITDTSTAGAARFYRLMLLQ
ncbi:MAG TPA: lamin tail domain-containing protein, partial [Verrucomicrobiae bacterium]|nr:lamin tail domain-containing protein [Verrucomicrobiae bacterium]